MSAHNWKELLDDPEVERVVQRAVHRVRGGYKHHSRGDLISDDFESYAWDHAVTLAEKYEGEPEGFYGFLFIGLTGYGQASHYAEFIGKAGTLRREANNKRWSIDESIELYGGHAEAMLFNGKNRADDPLSIVLQMETLEGHLRRAVTRNKYADQDNSPDPSPYCSEALCLQPTAKIGLCERHYQRHLKHWGNQTGTTPTCCAPNCTLLVTARDLCENHYARERRRRQNENDPWPETVNQTCSGDNCDRPIHANGLCPMHYQQERAARETPPCKHTDCNAQSYRDGLCRPHHRKEQTQNAPPCNVPDCTKPSATRGLCPMHYQRQRAKNAPPCTEPGCTRPGLTRGMCPTHYNRHSRARKKEHNQ